jgi:hypothetical protein
LGSQSRVAEEDCLNVGVKDGTPVIRYDNEKGKGDHRHIRNREEPYRFKNVETLIADFLKDIENNRRMK